MTDQKITICTYINSPIDLSLEDVLDFLESAVKEGRKVLHIYPEDLAGYDGLEGGVIVIWEGEADTHPNTVRDAFRDQWEADMTGTGPGCKG